jgi:hypothetical protein
VRRVEQIDDPVLNKRAAARAKELAELPAKDLTLAQRLTLRALEQKTTILFPSAQGDIPVEVRLPMAAELDDIMRIQHEIEIATEKGNEKAKDNLTDQMCGILGDLCTDPSLNQDFFKSGLFAMSEIVTIFRTVRQEMNNRIMDVQSFRPEAER